MPRGKPAPDVYLEAARRLGVAASACAAVEDSHNGIRSAKAAGMRVFAVPNPTYPPDEEALAEADVVLDSLGELTPEVVDRSGSRPPELTAPSFAHLRTPEAKLCFALVGVQRLRACSRRAASHSPSRVQHARRDR